MMKIFFLLFFMSSLAEAASLFTVENSTLIVNGNVHQLTSYIHDQPPEIKLPPGSKLISCQFAGKKCSGNPIVLKLSGKVPKRYLDTGLSLRYSLQGKVHAITLTVLPSSFPEFHQEGKSEVPLPLIFSVSSLTDKKLAACHLFIVSPAGELQFYRSLETACHDFRPHRIDNKTYYSYSLVDETLNKVGYVGPRVILDPDFHEIKRVASNNDVHEFLLLSLNHWIGFEFILGRLSSGKVFLDKRLREWKDGELIFDWGASDIIRQYGSEASTNAIQTEYRGEVVAELFHMNAILKIGDRGFIVGLGHEGVGFLDRKTKKLTWNLGGLYDDFNLRMFQHPLLNHTPDYDEKKGEITLFTNQTWGVVGSPPRIARYQLDLDQKKLISMKTLRLKNEFVYIMGSVQVSGEHLSIGFGSKNIGKYDFIEMHESGRESWKIFFDKGRAVYRFYRRPYGE